MIRFLIFINFLMVFLSSCQHATEMPFNEENETLLILEKTIDTVIKNHYFNPQNFEHNYSLANIYIFFTDSLKYGKLNQNILIESYAQHPNYYNRYFDSTFTEFFLKIDSNSIRNERSFDFHRIHLDKKYNFFGKSRFKQFKDTLNQEKSSYLLFRNFSTISYSKDKRKACLYIECYCGSTCGFGNWYFLEKKNNIWTISKIFGVFVS